MSVDAYTEQEYNVAGMNPPELYLRAATPAVLIRAGKSSGTGSHANLYDVIRPFLRVSSGGDQENSTMVEVIAVIVKESGGPVGAGSERIIIEESIIKGIERERACNYVIHMAKCKLFLTVLSIKFEFSSKNCIMHYLSSLCIPCI